jgi:hypothetical protein
MSWSMHDWLVNALDQWPVGKDEILVPKGSLAADWLKEKGIKGNLPKTTARKLLKLCDQLNLACISNEGRG